MKNIILLTILFLALSGFTFVNISFERDAEVDSSKTIYAGIKPAPYCQDQGVTKDNSSAEQKKLYRKYKRQCVRKYNKKVASDPTLAKRKFLKKCLNKRFEKKDPDCDGIVTEKSGAPYDNCPNTSNSAQKDDDMDGTGNACEMGLPASLTL